jgi:dinuclear metal center YbgI/SA1388 family protein
MVHHGIFKSQVPEIPQFKGILRNRLKLLLVNNINLAGFHLPLDAHPVIGNNISLVRLLGLKKTGVLKSPQYGEIGFIGEYPRAVSFQEFYNLVSDKLPARPYVIPAGPKKVKRVGIVSGGAENDFVIAREQGADTYLCGQVREATVRAVEESGINFINAGHYNTEKLGIINLGELVAKKFGIKAEFVDIPNDI